jgi:hypothetical protein
MKRLHSWLKNEFWGSLVPLWIFVRHPRQISEIIHQAEEMTLTWTMMWDKSPEEAAERALQIFHLLFLQRFRHLCHPEWVAALERTFLSITQPGHHNNLILLPGLSSLGFQY